MARPSSALDADSATLVTIAVPFSDTASPRSTDQAGEAAYDNGNHTSTVVVTHTDGSVAFNTVIWDSTAPSSYSYTLDLADGFTLHQNSSGPTAQVYPTDYGRDQLAVGPEANEAAWGEALEKGDRSRLDHNNLHDQFSCHFLGRATTAGKESWNLDSNRPDVGLAATIAASCNPQGGED